MDQVQALLQMCFPGYPSRAYFKLPPHFRYLGFPSQRGEILLKGGVSDGRDAQEVRRRFP